MEVFPGGARPSATTTVTTSILGWNPTKTVIIDGHFPSPGGSWTDLVIPPAGAIGTAAPKDWTCSCITGAEATATVTVTRPASPAPTITITGTDGTPTEAPASKFPCSDDDDNPCKGGTLSDWQKFTVSWTAGYPRSGPPAPFVKRVNFADDGILTVTDDENKAEHFEVKLDGRLLGETREEGFDRSKHCGKDADACMKKGWSHGFFSVPKGNSHS